MVSKKSVLGAALLATTFAGCSNLVETTRQSLLGDEKPRQQKTTNKKQWVSKSQYDDLLAKYKNLSIKYENLKDQNLGAGNAYDQVSELTNSKKTDGVSETIDVFGKDGLANGKTAAPAKPPVVSIQDDATKIDQELDYFKRALQHKQAGKLDEALKVFQFLEKSNTKQISVRAKNHIGSIYFEKKQYDLALQVYESIIRKNSFSGLVITALDYASKCSKQLGLSEKQLKYESILRDFFEVQV